MAGPTFGLPAGNIQGSYDFTAGRAPEAVDPELFNQLTDNNPFLALTQQLGGEKEVDQKQFFFQEDMLPPRTIKMTGAIADTSTLVFPVNFAEYTCLGEQLFNTRTLERCLVASTSGSSLGGANTVTVAARGGLGSTPANINNADEWRITARSFGDKENANVPNVVSQPGRNYNYVQDFQKSAIITRDAENRTLYQKKSERQRLDDQALMLFGRDLEMMMLTGIPYPDVNSTTTGAKYWAGGLISYIPTANIYTAVTGTPGTYEFNPTEVSFNDVLGAKLVGIGNPRKYVFCGYKARNWFNALVASDRRYRWDDEIRNLMITEYRSNVQLKIITHNLLDNYMADWAFVVDPDYVKMVYYKGARPKLYPGIQNKSDIRYLLDVYEGEISAEFPAPQVHMLFKGLAPTVSA